MANVTDDKSSISSSNINAPLQDHPQQQQTNNDPKLWRDLLAYWILGLCNNYGYVVMLSAAHDIIVKFNTHDGYSTDNHSAMSTKSAERNCHIASTGTILLADIIPALIMKGMAPFIPFWVNIRIFGAIIMATAGFLFVGLADSEFLALLGVVMTSASSGLGETTFLAYSSKFNKNVVSTWSSGTGGAGIAGSLSYAALKSFNIDHQTSMLIMLTVPILECIAFWLILRKPSVITPINNQSNTIDNENRNAAKKSTNDKSITIYDQTEHDKPLINFKEKLFYIPHLLKYMIPLTSIYIAEYFINQGLFELVYFEDIFLDKASQYRWLNVDYQIGVFISRSTVNLYSINRIWLMAIFQFINVIYFLCEVILFITPNIWFTFVIVFWEGLLGGGAYVNTFYKMSKEISPIRRQFALSVVAIADSIGIAIAGFTAIPVHNAICKLPAPMRHYWL